MIRIVIMITFIIMIIITGIDSSTHKIDDNDNDNLVP